MDDRHLIWRASLRPAPGLPLRPITWDLRFLENEVAVRSDLDREGEMRDVDFRDVRRRLDGVLLSEHLAHFLASSPPRRLRRSLYWQIPPPHHPRRIRPLPNPHQGEFAIAGLRRTANGPWEIDQIKAGENAEQSQHTREHFLQWLEQNADRHPDSGSHSR